MITYDYPLFRPPAEADNIIVQVTLGCSYNNCLFCSMYKTKNYQEKSLNDIYKDIDILAAASPLAHKIFLADGDALALPTNTLVSILKYLQESFPKLRRVSTYASAQNLQDKSTEDLKLLQSHKLNLIYYGIETGNDVVLKKITKGVSKQEIIDSLNKVPKSMKISATVILGIGGAKYSDVHIKDTADIINNTTINYLSTLQLGLQEDAKENFYKHFNDYMPLDDYQLLQEQKQFLKLLNTLNKIIFRSNHASNALHLSGTLPKDTTRLIEQVIQALKIGDEAFVPKGYRGF
ncbi:radical SAM protein [Sulfurimonas sp. SAG-AH-194-C20]|nr:radical SAM protein [Sulfurimonas sp. SAG-AH-194-C20]MDF1879627.1 radical SAM protein [Sulfurimonas sp. SAG-AH-194-C20]